MSVAATTQYSPVAAQRCDERTAVASAYGQWLRDVLPRQVCDGSDDHGAFDEYGNGWRDGRWTAFVVAKLIAARCWADEIGIDPISLDEPIRGAVEFISRRQSTSGELDLGGMYSPNEIGFPIPGLVAGFSRLAEEDTLPDVRSRLEVFLRRGGEAVLAGHAYTANHRWTAACAPLAALHSLWKDPRYLQKIESYLADAIDCDEDGLWHYERCPNYSDVANHGLIAMADFLDRPELLESVVRHCRLMLQMLHPNGEADCSFSHRQSRGAALVRGMSYMVARRAAIHSGDGRLTTLATRAAAGGFASDMLFPLPFEIDNQPGPMPTAHAPETRYERHLKSAQIIRRRTGATSLTISADSGGHFFDSVRDAWGGVRRSDDWIHLHHGSLVIQSIHLAVGGMQCLQPDWLEVQAPGRYRLCGKRDGWQHTQHFRPGSPTIPMEWDLKHEILIEDTDHDLRLNLRADAPRALTASLRLFVRAGAIATGCGMTDRVLSRGETIALSGGEPLELTCGSDALQIAGLPASCHTVQIEHAEPIPSSKMSHCAVLTIGLRMPIELNLQFTTLAACSQPVSNAAEMQFRR